MRCLPSKRGAEGAAHRAQDDREFRRAGPGCFGRENVDFLPGHQYNETILAQKMEEKPMKKTFSAGAWDMEGLTYAYSHRFAPTPEFTQMADHIVNEPSETGYMGFDFVSLLSTETYGPGVTVTTRCRFEGKDAAPLIFFADSMAKDPDGHMRYGNYVEVVLYKNGINVWRLWLENGQILFKKLMAVEFPVDGDRMHTLSVRTEPKLLHIDIDGRKMTLRIEDLFARYHVGINACEGYCRFYDLEVVPAAE